MYGVKPCDHGPVVVVLGVHCSFCVAFGRKKKVSQSCWIFKSPFRPQNYRSHLSLSMTRNELSISPFQMLRKWIFSISLSRQQKLFLFLWIANQNNWTSYATKLLLTLLSEESSGIQMMLIAIIPDWMPLFFFVSTKMPWDVASKVTTLQTDHILRVLGDFKKKKNGTFRGNDYFD